MNMEAPVRRRLNVVLKTVTTLVVSILLAQLWLFTVTLDVMESGSAPSGIAVAAVLCSVVACAAVWVLIGLFVRAERSEAEGRK
jgi:hypothetical protein